MGKQKKKKKIIILAVRMHSGGGDRLASVKSVSGDEAHCRAKWRHAPAPLAHVKTADNNTGYDNDKYRMKDVFSLCQGVWIFY